jgi:hypothetical protein
MVAVQRSGVKQRKTIRQRLADIWRALKWWWTGGVLSARLSDAGSEEYIESRKAIARVVTQGPFAPDCVSACVIRGGHTILLRHDSATEAFIGKDYEHAANKAIEWIQRQGAEVNTRKTSNVSYAGLKRFGLAQRKFSDEARRRSKKKRRK